MLLEGASGFFAWLNKFKWTFADDLVNWLWSIYKAGFGRYIFDMTDTSSTGEIYVRVKGNRCTYFINYHNLFSNSSDQVTLVFKCSQLRLIARQMCSYNVAESEDQYSLKRFIGVAAQLWLVRNVIVPGRCSLGEFSYQIWWSICSIKAITASHIDDSELDCWNSRALCCELQ